MSDYLDEMRRHAQQAADGRPPAPALARIVITCTASRQIEVQMIGTEDELVIRGLYDKARVVLDEHFRQASSRIVRPPG